MASVDLLFAQTPVTGSPVDLVFGPDVAVIATIELALVGQLDQPALLGAIQGVPVTPALLAGQLALPGLSASLSLRGTTLAALSGALPLPSLSASITLRPITPAALADALPAPTLQCTLLLGPVIEALLAGALPMPDLSADFFIQGRVGTALQAALPETALIGVIEAAYLSNTDRPLVGQAGGQWQRADKLETGMQDHRQASHPLPAGVRAEWQQADQAVSGAAAAFGIALAQSNDIAAGHQQAVGQGAQAQSLYSDALRDVRRMIASAFQDAQKVQTAQNRQRHQDGWRDCRPNARSAWQVAAPHRTRGVTSFQGPAAPLSRYWDEHHKEAMRPPAGMYVRPIVTPREVCYLPSPDLLFSQAWAADTNLVFICERHVAPVPSARVVVPFLRTYVTINSITLRRVDSDIPIPAYSFAMSLDWQSWTWSWSASIALASLPIVKPGSDRLPVEVEAVINGVPYRLACEGFSSQKQFASGRVGVKGRGLAAVLDAPYAPVLNFSSTSDRSAQQLMMDALTTNGVSIGWELDWGLTDWLVPGSSWAHQGAYISAVTAITQAAGGYVQPHNTDKTLRILPGYPATPWAWGDVTPDFELPSSVVTVDSTDWTRKPDYNRVFVSGMSNGVLGQVTRAGTAGDSVAPMITDALITHADAARQRGICVLSDTGAQENISLTLPVLAETGLIMPGQFVRYVDSGFTRMGLVRSTALNWARPKMRQTLGIETHVV